MRRMLVTPRSSRPARQQIIIWWDADPPARCFADQPDGVAIAVAAGSEESARAGVRLDQSNARGVAFNVLVLARQVGAGVARVGGACEESVTIAASLY